jgi:hypothetical protein
VEGLGIPIQIIGQAVPEPGVRIVGAEGTRELAWPARDAIAALFED